MCKKNIYLSFVLLWECNTGDKIFGPEGRINQMGGDPVLIDIILDSIRMNKAAFSQFSQTLYYYYFLELPKINTFINEYEYFS